ncbi:MAG: NYN domain-containing protein [Candidatus Buchananbacteria bacterium]|nr:NYN domain-containing protein [Candidatus Buchananbacteria bacterium]
MSVKRFYLLVLNRKIMYCTRIFSNMVYVCVFKPTLELKDGRIKGNVDAELVLHAMVEYANYDKAVIVSGDGDFYCLVQYFLKQNKLKKVLVPNQASYSSLLDRLSTPENNILDFVNNLRRKLEYKNKSK